MMKYAMSCFLLITLIPAGSTTKDVTVETIELAKRFSVAVVCITIDVNHLATSLNSLGSGFVVNRRGDFITASHVTDAMNKQHGCTPSIYLSKTVWADASTADLTFVEFSECWSEPPPVDLSLCRPLENPFMEPHLAKSIGFAAIRTDRLKDGEPVAFTGFPLGIVRPLTSKGDVATYAGDDLIIDRAAWPGASGSPVYDGDGRVVGVVRQAGANVAGGLAFATPADKLQMFLQTAIPQLDTIQENKQTQNPATHL